MTIVSIVGVAIGVAALIIVLSVMGGFEQDLKNKLLAGEPHLEVTSKTAATGFSLKKYPLKEFQDTFTEAQSMEPYIQADVVLKRGKHLAGVSLFAVDPNRSANIWGFESAIVEGTMSSIGEDHAPLVSVDTEETWPGILLGDEVATSLGAQVGDKISILSPQGASGGEALAGATLIRNVVLVGTFHTGSYAYDSKWAVVRLSEGRRFMVDYDESLDREEFVTGIAMSLKDPYSAELVEKKIDKWPELAGVSWLQANKGILFALKLEKFAMGAILHLIVIVAAFSISGTMMMTVMHKRSQVSVLRALGMRKSDVRRLFVFHGVTIGAVGSLAGLLIGLGACLLLKYFKLIALPEGIYYLKTLPVKYLPVEYLVICVAAMFCSMLASVYPSHSAAEQDPSRGMRFE